ncbi:MAG: GH3 auxin-responsive promoter family protein [Spirosomataceae bacterium]
MTLLGSLLKRGIKLTGSFRPKKLNPMKLQKKTFIKLLNKARFTQFGEKFGFGDMLDAALFHTGKGFYEQYKSKVPIYDYSSIYAEWWHRTRTGEKDVCWPGRVKYFALSSGTSDAASKFIPVTKDMVKAIKSTSIKQILALSNYQKLPARLYEKGYLMLGGSTELTDAGIYKEGDLSGITASNIPYWFQRFYKPGKKISKYKDWGAKLDLITRRAKDWDIGYVVGVPAWIQLLMEKIIAYYDVQNIHEIWPNLEVFCHGGVSFEPYRVGFEKLLGRPITYIETYLASEGFLAYQTHPDVKAMQLVLNNGIFFEFVPFNDNNFDNEGNIYATAETLLIDEVEENKDYALLISTVSGAWRYLIGDTVRFTNVEKAEIIITGRTKHFLSLCGEHLSVDNMNRAIELVSHELNIDVREFTVIGKPADTLFGHHWYIGTDDTVEASTLIKRIDQHLKALNDDYATERAHALNDVSVTVVPSHVFYDWLAVKGKMGAQHKFPRVLKKPELIEGWEQFVKSGRQS